MDCFAHPLRGLNENFDPSKATSARPRKLGLRPQTVRGALRDASNDEAPSPFSLSPLRERGRGEGKHDGVPKIFIGPLQGRAGFG